MIVPSAFLPHRVTIEPYMGDTAYGPSYGPPVPNIRAMVAPSVRQVRRATDGRETVSTAQVITAPGIDCPPGSRITLPGGRVTTALSVADHSAPGLPVPDCMEVMCE